MFHFCEDVFDAVVKQISKFENVKNAESETGDKKIGKMKIRPHTLSVVEGPVLSVVEGCCPKSLIRQNKS